MKQVAAFTNVHEAEMLRAYLEGSGIRAYVRDSLTVTANWTLSNAIGGVKVDVADEDAERAFALVRDFQSPAPADPADPPPPRRHTIARYVKLASALSAVALLLVAILGGFHGGTYLAFPIAIALGLGAGIAFLCALYDL